MAHVGLQRVRDGRRDLRTPQAAALLWAANFQGQEHATPAIICLIFLPSIFLPKIPSLTPKLMTGYL
jgi:hypothetical protein